MNRFAERAIRFYTGLDIPGPLPGGVGVLNPYQDPEVLKLIGVFFRKFFNDNEPRRILLGINPGRFGAGITGITFSDPIALKNHCGIDNHFEPRAELSSRFVYEMISAFGGAAVFFSRFFLSAVCPLGFIRDGKNLNYYDDRQLEAALLPYISDTLKQQMELGIRTDIAYSMGEGKNLKFLQKLNRELGIFDNIIPLPHPRWVMQYRYKRRDEFIRRYIDALRVQ